MTILQMRYFVAVCENGSLSQASKVLFLTQPTLSMAINQLEKEFNLVLFERKNNSMILTKEGEYFYDNAKAILESISSFEKSLLEISEDKQSIRIGVPPMIGSFLFPKIYNEYITLNPGVKFEIWEEGSLSIRNKIQQKSLDLGFSILNDSANEQYEKETILETELLFCVAKDNPLSSRSKLTIEDIKNEPIMLMKEGFFQNRLINQLYNDVQVNPKIILVSSQLSVIRNFVKMNVGSAFLMKELVDPSDSSIIGIPFSEGLKINIGIIYRKDAKMPSAAMDFINFSKRYKKEYKKNL
ncbi:LysR family transcriptional regulator [Acholeplasma sp. OttesenSCG-928-E16]|nr:LysR family transcriptional regulator [Acholeplasma sp. OttesenSCG-928-E16]